MPIGSRYSSKSISPGVIGGFMSVTCDVTGVLSMVVDDLNLGRALFSPSKDNAPLLIDAN